MTKIVQKENSSHKNQETYKDQGFPGERIPEKNVVGRHKHPEAL